ncbi:MAG: hypothetical protein PHE29_13985 [Tissierellia bacterium]|nr:hypothetical protein [Tissierellia bacterium]
MIKNFDQQLEFLNSMNYVDDLVSFKPLIFIRKLKQHFDITKYISDDFYSDYYHKAGKNRDYELHSILLALLISNFFYIPSNKFLVFCLAISQELRDFCGFGTSLPNESYFSTFKSDFESHITDFFNILASSCVDMFSEYSDSLPVSNPEKQLSEMIIYDTSGFKPKVKENNPKFVATEIKRAKTYAKKLSKDANPYAYAYSHLPKSASSNSSIVLDYVNGHYGYFYKFGMLTNGFGVPVGLHFFDESFYANLPSDFDTPESQKFAFDNASLKPVLSNFALSKKFTTFLGDSEFDSYDNFSYLKSEGFSKAIIPLNPRNSKLSNAVDFKVSYFGYPVCPKTNEPFINVGICKGKNRSARIKYVCPKSFRPNKSSSAYSCSCIDKCRDTNSTVTKYVYPDSDFRLNPGINRDDSNYDITYKIRATIERTISSVKSNPSIANPNTSKLSTMRADLVLSCCTKVIISMLALALNKISCVRSVKKIINLIA